MIADLKPHQKHQKWRLPWRDQALLLASGGIKSAILSDVQRYNPYFWIEKGARRVSYAISFTRNFYKPQLLRTLEEIGVNFLVLEKEAEPLLDGIIKENK